jgi:hypothetical protein
MNDTLHVVSFSNNRARSPQPIQATMEHARTLRQMHQQSNAAIASIMTDLLRQSAHIDARINHTLTIFLSPIWPRQFILYLFKRGLLTLIVCWLE